MSGGVAVALRGTGSAFPARLASTREIAALVSAQSDEPLTEEWLLERTGIVSRHLSNTANAEERTAGLATRAAKAAMEDAGFSPDSIDHVLVATCTPEDAFPSTACRVAEALRIPRANCLDLNSACTGFLSALSAARAWLGAGEGKRALVIGADVLSPFLDWEDRNTCPIFGDGASAVALETAAGSERGGVFATELGSAPELLGLFSLSLAGAGPRTVQMQGPEAFRSAVRTLADLCKRTIERAGIRMDEIDLVVPHQANFRILEAVSKRVGLPLDRFATQIRTVGNTSAASVPAALDHSIRAGALRPGGLALLCAYGAGVTYGSALLRIPGKKGAS